MSLKNRMLIVAAAVMALSITTTAGVLAHECTNADKKPGAGSAGTVVINVETGEFDASGAKLNEHSGRAQGGFATLQLVNSSGDVLFEGEVFAQRELPEQAQNAGPGDSLCDGKGIDNAFACS